MVPTVMRELVHWRSLSWFGGWNKIFSLSIVIRPCYPGEPQNRWKKPDKWKTMFIPFNSLPCARKHDIGCFVQCQNIRHQGSKQFPRWIRWRPWAPECEKVQLCHARDIPISDTPINLYLQEAPWFWTTSLGCSCFLGFQSLPGNVVYTYYPNI